MPAAAPTIRVVVRLPWNRPENPLSDPPPVEWTAEKADTLWKVIERSRSSDSGGADWKALAAHLEVPLPYLLYRVNARFEEDIRGLKDIQGALSPSGSQPPPKAFDATHLTNKPFLRDRSASHLANSSHLAASSQRSTSLGVRARLTSLSNNSPRKPKKATSSSTLTVQSQKKAFEPLGPTSPSSPEGTDSEDEAAMKEEDADRDAEEQESLERKLQQLQMMVTNDALGLVSSVRAKNKAKSMDRGRTNSTIQTLMRGSYRQDTLSSRSTSQSISSASSPQGSIPDIPSPPETQHPPSLTRSLSVSKSSSPPAVSPRSAVGQRYRPLAGRSLSEQSSSHGSETSSFSDLSDASLSASALESALLSNIRGNSSRLSQFSRSRMLGGS